MLFLPQLTIVLHRITKENLHFSPGRPANGTTTIFGMGMRQIRGVRSMDRHPVQMLAWNGKFWHRG